MLSGGLDSSLIVALMARHMSEPLKTFAVGFAGEDSELPDARRVADELGAEHHELEVRMRTEPGDLSRLVWHLDEPLADLSSLGFLPLCELARRDVTVALSGQGADELFGGYRKHRVASLAGSWQRLPGAARRGATATLRRAPGRAGRLADALDASDPVARLIASSGYVYDDIRGDLFSGALAEHSGAAHAMLEGKLTGAPNAAPLEAALYLDARLGLVDDMLTYFDRASMACSLEVRVPFLDHELVELARASRRSTRCAASRASTSCGSRPAARSRTSCSSKRKRGFFNEAVGSWAEAAGREPDRRRLLLDPNPAYERILDRNAVERAVSDLRAGRGNRSCVLALVMLELWLGEYLPRALSPSSVPIAA